MLNAARSDTGYEGKRGKVQIILLVSLGSHFGPTNTVDRQRLTLTRGEEHHLILSSSHFPRCPSFRRPPPIETLSFVQETLIRGESQLHAYSTQKSSVSEQVRWRGLNGCLSLQCSLFQASTIIHIMLLLPKANASDDYSASDARSSALGQLLHNVTKRRFCELFAPINPLPRGFYCFFLY